MKKALFRIVNVLMAAVVLLSSTGFGLVEHSCQMRGKKVTIVTAEKVACEGCPAPVNKAVERGPAVKKTDCCQDDQRYKNVDIGSSLSQLVAKFFKAVTEAVVTGIKVLVSALLTWLFTSNESVAVHAANAPPAAYGRALLAFVQSFLI